jgi:hypothetical protein
MWFMMMKALYLSLFSTSIVSPSCFVSVLPGLGTWSEQVG